MGNDFEEIKERVDIVSEIERRTGKKTKRTGASWELEQCPFCTGHECFKIFQETKSWSCFQCDGKVGGSIVDFVIKERGCSRHEALLDLAEAAGYTLQHDTTKDEQDNQRGNQNDPRRQIFEAATSYYARTLQGNPKAMDYQKNIRGHSDKVLTDLSIGFADGRLSGELEKRGFTLDEVLSSGLVVPDKKGGYRDYFIPGVYVYPHKDKTGATCDFTIKDPKKKYNYRLAGQHRIPGAPFMNMEAFKGDTVVLVEGENDIASVYGRGNFPQVAATTGQISEGQIKHLKEWVTAGQQVKTIYLCFDNDKAGEKYTERIKQELGNYCISDKQHQINKRLRRYQRKKRKEDDSELLTEEIPALKPVILKTIHLDNTAKDVDDLLRITADTMQPEDKLSSLVDQATRHLKPLKDIIAAVKAWFRISGNKDQVNEIGEVTFDYFNTMGGFFVNGEDCRLFYNGKIHHIGNNISFKALLYQTGGINYADNNTNKILEVVKAEAYQHGKHTTTMGWIHTNTQKKEIFFDLNNSSNTIAKIQPGRIDLIQNGANDDQVLLESTPRMISINYQPGANVKEGMEKFKEILMDNFTCNESNKFYVAARVINTVILEFVKAKGLTKFSGNQGTAKSCAARLISYLVLGTDCVSQGSVASYRSEATKSPFIIPDNLEKENRTKDFLSFLLLAATGAINQKRDSNTNSDNVYEENKAQIITTSIEPFTESELVSRTFDISFSKKYRNKNFPGENLLKIEIERHRDLIMSSFFKMVAFDILPTFEQDLSKIYQFLNIKKQGHSKERLNEAISCLFLICKQLIKYIPHSVHTGEDAALMILDDWLNEQHDLAVSTQQENDPMLYRLETLLNESTQLNKEHFTELYGIQTFSVSRDIMDGVSEVSFTVSSKELCTAFSILSKNKNIPNPFTAPGVLGSRLHNSTDVLEDAGWSVQMRHKACRGQHKHKLTKRIVE